MKTRSTFYLVKNHLLSVFLLITSSSFVFSQTSIKGKITDKKGDPIPFANVYLEGSYDGTSSDLEGNYLFPTTKTGDQTIIFQCIGFEEYRTIINISGKEIQQDVKLFISSTQIEDVNITAGSFEASDKKKSTLLKPIDIVTTAGGAADIFQVIQMLPGTQRVGESEGLFVRGGSASETKTFIDGMLVQNPYFSSVPDIPQRGRFQPYLFKGTLFSSGGYSSQYGKALSSALILNTEDVIDTTTSSFGINLVGVSAYHAQKWKASSLSVGADYANLKPFFSIDKQQTDWVKEPETMAGEINFKLRPNKRDIFKFYSTYSKSKLALNYPVFYDTLLINTRNELENGNLYINSSYKKIIKDDTDIFVGVSYANNNDNSKIDRFQISDNKNLLQGRVSLSRYFDKNSILLGGELHSVNNTYNGYSLSEDVIKDTYSAVFCESNIFLTKLFAISAGMRLEHSTVIKESNWAPRISMAYKMGINSQVSFAYGIFHQHVEDSILIRYGKSNFEKAHHYILNYQWMKDERSFRLELYDKEYKDLVMGVPGGSYSNDGFGYARGVDLFWRDKKTLPNTDYWVSYSYIDTKRKYRDFSRLTIPSFVSDHTLSFIYKYFITGITTSVGFTYTFSSGRNYQRFVENIQYQETTPQYHNFSVSIGKLASVFNQFTVFYLSVDNIFNREHVFAYRYSGDGKQRMEVGATNLRTIFFGCYISIK